MNDDLFAELEASVREAGKILRGDIPASRRLIVDVTGGDQVRIERPQLTETPMNILSIQEAQSKLSDLIHGLAPGEEIILNRERSTRGSPDRDVTLRA